MNLAAIRWPLRIGAGIVALYLGLVGAAWWFERAMLYHPDGAVIAPGRDDPAGIQDLHILTMDGETLRAWYLAPRPGQPVILFFDGNGGRIHLQGGRYTRMADAGVGFLSVAFRGYSGSTGHPTERGLHTDARAAYAWLRRTYAPDQIVVHGFSLGSGVAVRLAAQVPVRALILEAPYTATSDVAAGLFPWLPVHLVMRDQFRSRDVIGQVHAPVLIAHGDRDTVVPFEEGQILFALANEPKTFVRMPGSGHATLTRDGVYEHYFRFLGVPAR